MFWNMGWDPGRKGYHGLSLVDSQKNFVDETRVKGLEGGYQCYLYFKDLAHQNKCSLRLAFEWDDSTIMEKLYQRGVRHIYGIAPRRVETYKGAYRSGRDKCDELDAFIAACFLADWANDLKPYEPPSPFEKKVRAIAAELDQISHWKTKYWEQYWSLVERVTPDLKEAIGESKESQWFLAVMSHLPGKFKHMSSRAFESFCRKRKCGLEQPRLVQLYQAFKALQGEIDPQLLKHRAQRLDQALGEKRYWEREAGHLLGQWEDAWILSSVRGIGPATMIRLVAHLGTDWSQHTPASISRYAGLAPVIRASGVPDEASLLRMDNARRRRLNISRRHRLACNKNLKSTFCNFSRYSLRYHPWAHQTYLRLTRERRQGQWEALRNLSIKWVRILYAMMRDKTAYETYKHERNIDRKMDPLMRRA